MSESKVAKESHARAIVHALHQAGFEAYFAGGCVRDKVMGNEPLDFDIATSATPDQVQQTFPKTIPVGAQFGVILVIEHAVPYEVATFRTEGSYADGRRPEHVEFATLEEDAKRRDFTVNGLYFDVRNEQVIDQVGGIEDIQKKCIRTIGQATERFREDHLRMLRAVRFCVKLGFQLEPSVHAAIKAHADWLRQGVSYERIREEFSKLMTSPNPRRGIELLDETGLLQQFLPEAEAMKGVEQPMEFHPEGDVYIHTMLLLEQLSSPPLELALGALLHDISKPETFERAADRIRFHGHDMIGAEKSRKILKRLTYPNKVIDLVCELVRHHLKFKDVSKMRQSTLKRFLGMERFDLHLRLHKIDCMASHGDLTAYEFCQKKIEEFAKEPPPPMRLLTGKDLLAMGYSAGRQMGDILRAVEDAILEGEVKTKEEGEAYVRKNFALGEKKS